MLNSKVFPYIKLFLMIVAILAVGIFSYQQKFMTNIFAFMDQDDNNGSIVYNATDDVGTYGLAGVELNNGYMVISGTGTNGSFGISQKKPIQSFGWQNIYIEGNNINSNTIRYIKFYDCGANPGEIGPQFATGYGTLDVNGKLKFDISTIDPNKNCFSAKIDMKASGGVKPEVSKVTTTFIPKPVIDMDLSGDADVNAGECVTYTYRRAMSYVDKNNFGIYVTLPASSSNTVTNFNAAYNQFPGYNPTFKSASDNGIYTAGGTTINGVNIPANSIYRDPNNAKEGNTYNYKFTICVPKGTQNLVRYHVEATQVYQSETKYTNIVDTTIHSVPIPELNQYSSGLLGTYLQGPYFSSGISYLYSQSSNKIVKYLFDVNNGFYNQSATEDIVRPNISIDFSDAFVKMQTLCNDSSVSISKTRVTLPANFARDTSNSNIATLNFSDNKQPLWHYGDIFAVDYGSGTGYSNCIGSGEILDIQINYSATNFSPSLNYHYPFTITSSPVGPTVGPAPGSETYYIVGSLNGYNSLYGAEIYPGNNYRANGVYKYIDDDTYFLYKFGSNNVTSKAMAGNFVVTRIPDGFEVVEVVPSPDFSLASDNTVVLDNYPFSPHPTYGALGAQPPFPGVGATRPNVGANSYGGLGYPPGDGWGVQTTPSDSYFGAMIRGIWTPANNGYNLQQAFHLPGITNDTVFTGKLPIANNFKLFYSDSTNPISGSVPSFNFAPLGQLPSNASAFGSSWSDTYNSNTKRIGFYQKCLQPSRRSDPNGGNDFVPNYNEGICDKVNAGGPFVVLRKINPSNVCGTTSDDITFEARSFVGYISNNNENKDSDFQSYGQEMGNYINLQCINRGQEPTKTQCYPFNVAPNNISLAQESKNTVKFINGSGDVPAYVEFTQTGSDEIILANDVLLSYNYQNGPKDLTNASITITLPNYSSITNPVDAVILNPNISIIDSNHIKINIGSIAAFAGGSTSIHLKYPGSNNTSITSLQYDAHFSADGPCNPTTQDLSKTLPIKYSFTSPNLSGSKYVSTGAIDLTGTITYAIDLINQGTKVANGTWIVDNIAPGTEFTEAYTAGSIESFANFAVLASQNYQCSDCEVYFSKGDNMPAGSITKDVANTISKSGFSYNNFVLGSNNNGVWTPNGMTLAEVKRIAFNAKDVDINERNIVGFKVKNQDNVFSDTIVNVAAVVSNELKAATTNQVETNLLYDPRYNKFDISLEKYVHASGQPMTKSITGAKGGDQLYFELILKNLSGQLASNIVVRDMLPAGFTVNGNINTVDIEGSSSSLAGVGTYDSLTRTITWSGASLNSGDYAIMTIPVTIDQLPSCGLITNSGQIVSFTGIDINPNNHISSADVYQCSAFDVSITKTVDHYYTYTGDNLTYSLARNKVGGFTVQNYVITDTLPSEVSYVSSTNGGVYDPVTHKVSRNMPDLIGDTGGTFNVVVNVLSVPNNYIFTNNASICQSGNSSCCDPKEIDCSNNTGSINNELYDLSITKTNDGFNTSSGSLIHYNLKYSLSGNARNDIRVVDILPTNVQYISSTNGGVYDVTTNTISWTNLSLPTNGSSNLGVVVKVLTNNVYAFVNSGFIGTDTGVNCIDNTCNMCKDEFRCDNNQDHVPNGLYNLTIKKTNDTFYTKSGSVINYTLRYILAGLARNDIRVVDVLPTNVEYISSDNGGVYDPVHHTISWSNLSLPTNGSDYLHISTKVLSNNIYAFSNTGYVGTNTGVDCVDNSCNLCKGEANCGDNTGSIDNQIYDLSIIKTNDSYSTSSGSIINYNLRYTLSGLARNDIRVVDVLPTNVQYISSTNGGVYDSSSHTVSRANLSLPTNGSSNLGIVVKVLTNDVYEFTNTGYVGTDTGTCNGTVCNICKGEVTCNNNTGNASNGLFDLSIIKTNDGYYTKSGNYINYSLKYTLSGLARNDIRIIDILPSNLQFISGSNGASYSTATNLISWTNLSLPTNGSGYVYVTAKVLNNDIYNFTNTGVVGTNTGNICIGSGCDNNVCLDSGCKNINLCIGEYRCDNNTGTVDNGLYDLNIKKTVDKGSSYFDETLVYTLTYGLSGNARNDISIVDRLPDEVDFVSASLSGYRLSSGFAGLNGQFVVWTGLSLQKDSVGSVTISVKIKANTYFIAKGLSITSNITNNVVVGINTGNNDTGFTYVPEYNTGNNKGQAITNLRCNADPSVSCNGISYTPSTPVPLPGGGTPSTINVCRNDQVISINASELQSTDIQSNSCPKTLVCRNNKMIAISKSQKLSTDTPYCVPPYEPIPYVPPILIPKTGVDVFDGIESLR